MTREELTDKLTQVLNQFREEGTSVLLHLTFTDVGELQGDDEELWWDENMQMFIPEEPE
jgi:hypothetical protein